MYFFCLQADGRITGVGVGLGVGRGLKVAVYGICIEAPYCPQKFFQCYSIFFVTAGICEVLELHVFSR